MVVVVVVVEEDKRPPAVSTQTKWAAKPGQPSGQVGDHCKAHHHHHHHHHLHLNFNDSSRPSSNLPSSPSTTTSSSIRSFISLSPRPHPLSLRRPFRGSFAAASLHPASQTQHPRRHRRRVLLSRVIPIIIQHRRHGRNPPQARHRRRWCLRKDLLVDVRWSSRVAWSWSWSWSRSSVLVAVLATRYPDRRRSSGRIPFR